LAQVKTIDSTRTIEAPAWLMAMFAEIKLRSESTSPDDLVFCTRTGKPHGRGNLLSRGLYPAMERAGLQRKTFHALRHTHASLWIKDGGDVVTLSKRLGHSSPQVTVTTYMHAIEEANDDAVRRARVDAMYADSTMAAFLSSASQSAPPQGANVRAISAAADYTR
jgi:integrase